MNYILHLIVITGIYLTLAYSLNLSLGLGGLLSFCHAAFYGIGAYAYALLVKNFGVPCAPALGCCILITASLAMVIGAISIHFRGDLFLFATIGFQMIVFAALYNWVELTNGPYGIAGIPGPEILGLKLRTPLHYAFLAGVMNLVLLPALFVLYQSPFGMALKALREDEAAAESVGIHARRVYLQSFVITAAFAAVPGALYAAYVTYIDPTSFTLNESIFLVAVLLLGGSGNRKGPLAGVLIMVLLPEGLRFIGLPAEIVYNFREIIYGLSLAILMYFRPQGLMGGYKVT